MNDWLENMYKIFQQNNNNIDIKETKIGIVQSVSPLQICIGELVLYKENLFISENVLEHERQITIPTESGFTNKKIIIDSTLHVGDMVALRKLPFEKYYLENKVINGGDL